MRDSAPAILLVLLAAATGCSESTGPTKAIQPTITAGASHSCLLSRTGAASCWGDNAWGELGNGSKTSSTRPVPVSGGIEFTTITAGESYTCGLDRTGAAYCWGYYVELGNGSTTSSSVPTPVSGGLRFTQLVAGFSHACALTSSGAAYCWGSNPYGELGTGDTMRSLVPVPVAGGLTFNALATGGAHTCGITNSGAAYCWGLNGAGQLGNASAPNPSYVPVAVFGGLTFTAITAGDSHSCGIIGSGAPYCWGSNSYGESGNLSSGSSVPKAVIGFRTLTSVKDRKSTRLNSSHVEISYAVFCLKKKKKNYALSLLTQKKKLT